MYIDSDRRFEFRRIWDIRVRDIEIWLLLYELFIFKMSFPISQISCQVLFPIPQDHEQEAQAMWYERWLSEEPRNN